MSECRVMADKVRKVKAYDAIAFKRMYSNYCTDDYIEGRRTFNPPVVRDVHIAYDCACNAVYFRTGKTRTYTGVTGGVSEIMSGEAIVIWIAKYQKYYMWSKRKNNLVPLPYAVAKRMIAFTRDRSEYYRYFACGRMSRV